MTIESISDVNETLTQTNEEVISITSGSYSHKQTGELVLTVLEKWQALLEKNEKEKAGNSRELLIKTALELALQQRIETQNAKTASQAPNKPAIDLENNQKLANHILEAAKIGTNPIELAFQKFDLELAEMLFLIREKDLTVGKPTFDHPGYGFKIRYKSGDQHYVWSKPVQSLKLNGWGCEAPAIALQINIEALKLLMKFDTHKHTPNFITWQKQLRDMLEHAEFNCDLNGFYFLYPFLFEESYLSLPQQYKWRGLNQKGYLIDPVLSGIAIDINNPRHFWHKHRSPNATFYDFRPDDTAEIKELKDKIQKQVIWTIFCAYQPETSSSNLARYSGSLPN